MGIGQDPDWHPDTLLGRLRSLDDSDRDSLMFQVTALKLLISFGQRLNAADSVDLIIFSFPLTPKTWKARVRLLDGFRRFKSPHIERSLERRLADALFEAGAGAAIEEYLDAGWIRRRGVDITRIQQVADMARDRIQMAHG